MTFVAGLVFWKVTAPVGFAAFRFAFLDFLAFKNTEMQGLIQITRFTKSTDPSN
jgi:hypothetical protein